MLQVYEEQCKAAVLFQILKGQSTIMDLEKGFYYLFMIEPSHIFQVFAATVYWHVFQLQLYFSLFYDRKVNVYVINASFKASI